VPGCENALVTTTGSRSAQRAATIEALLDATIESLGRVGFAATTTRAVARDAGVSQGAQQHHFPTKAALVDAAINRAAERLLDEVAVQLTAGTERERARRLLEHLWDAYHLPVFAVVAELVGLARTDPDTAAKTAATLTAITDRVVTTATEALPTYAQRPGFRPAVLLAVAAVRDTAAVDRVPGTQAALPTLDDVVDAFLRAVD
jgi:AcrR family transcriptional regulator